MRTLYVDLLGDFSLLYGDEPVTSFFQGRLRRAHSVAMERLVMLAEMQGDYPAAIEYAERLLRHDPLHETTYRRLMRLHVLRHDRASALRVYRECITVLERELSVAPNADTQETYERLLNMRAPLLLNSPPPSFLEAATGRSLASEALFDPAAAHDDLPPELYNEIRARLHSLSPPALELARLAATIGQAFTADVLAQASSVGGHGVGSRLAPIL